MKTLGLVDSHCHLHMIDCESLKTNIDDIITKAEQSGVQHFLCVATTFEDHSALLNLANTFPQVTISVGEHPNDCLAHEPNTALDTLIRLGQDSKVVALGETGLDYYREHSANLANHQKAWFLAHINAAKQLSKPLIIHTRMAKQDTLDMLRSEQVGTQIGAVLHCFTEDWDMAKQALDLGLYISFSGIITFKNADTLREVVKKIPMDQLLVETDAPFLAPTPYRGKINQPAYVKEVAACVADIKGLSLEQVAAASTQNFAKLFGIVGSTD